MALPWQSDSCTQSRGQQIPHPQATKFYDDFDGPTAKRVKRYESTDSSLSRNISEDEESSFPVSPKQSLREIADSEDEDYEDGFSASQTDLESTLPSIKTDKKAIEEYEATRVAEQAYVEPLQEAASRRGWANGKSSIYVDAFNLALETVLKEEGHLFDEPETAVFDYWKSLSYEGQYLYEAVSSQGTFTYYF